MKQHAIPQNILDVEFKLFGKLTVREFIYIAAGVGFGGIFLYYFTNGKIPGILAIPIFLLTSGIGLFLGLVEIKDRKADTYMSNFIWAITHPTLRVWRNSQLDQKVEGVARERGLVLTTSKPVKNTSTNKPKIIGADQNTPSNQFIEQNTINQIDTAEQQRLAQIDQLVRAETEQLKQEINREALIVQNQNNNAQLAQYQTQPQSTNTPPGQIPAIQQPQPSPVPDETMLNRTNAQPIAVNQQMPVPQMMPQNPLVQQQELQPGQPIVLPRPQQPQNTINIFTKTSNGQPAARSVVLIKDTQGRTLQAQQTNDQGAIAINKPLQPGEYTIEVMSESQTFPQTRLNTENLDNQPINITAVS